MGLGSPSLANEFDRNPNAYFDEYCQELGEAPIDKPYEFCSFIKQANGEEKKIMDFKTGTPLIMQEPPPLPLYSRRESSWQSTPGPPWATSSPLKQSGRLSRSAPRN